jgi:nucleotide-binding universal stress UspA family protein
MRWIIGMEVHHRSTAAVQFARWLSLATRSRWDEDFVGVHVLDANHLAVVLRTRHFDEVLEDARTASEEELERASSGDGRPRVDVVQALTIAEGLEVARAAHGADGIIIARVARHESYHLLRLGDVGRRLLRRLPSPIVVVPPTFTLRSAGSGPIVALTGLGPDALPACRLAAGLAGSTGRELAMAHVADAASGDAALAEWIERHEVWPDATAVLHGDLAEAGLAFAEARGAALLAIGAGPLKGIRRLLGAKLACRLAAVAEVPLLVVPEQPGLAQRSDLAPSDAAPDPGAAHGPHPSGAP